MNVLQIFTFVLTDSFGSFLKNFFISILENFRLSLVALGIVPSAQTTTGNILKQYSLNIICKFLMSGL